MIIYVIDRRVEYIPQPIGPAGFALNRGTQEERWGRVIGALHRNDDPQIIMVEQTEHFRDLVERINTVAQNPWSIYLLRFLAHGTSAYIQIGRGITTAQIPNFRTLGHYMTPSNMNGRGIEIHGCGVLREERGRRFVQRIADAINLPVVASPYSQYSDNRFQFEHGSTRVEPSN